MGSGGWAPFYLKFDKNQIDNNGRMADFGIYVNLDRNMKEMRDIQLEGFREELDMKTRSR